MSTKQNDETQSRWYMVNKDGMATLCADQADAEQEAKNAQDAWPHMGPHRAVRLVEVGDAGFTAADMATAAAQGFREGQAAQQAPAGAVPDDQMIAEYGRKASRMMARDLTRFDAACEVDKYLREQGAPGYYRHRMSIILFGNVEGTEASRAPENEAPQPSPTPQADSKPAQVLWVSPEQFANLVDDDKAPSGTYLPVRKTSAGKFTMPLFTARAPADSVLEAAITYRKASDELLLAQAKLLGGQAIPIPQEWVAPFDSALRAQANLYTTISTAIAQQKAGE